MNEINYQPYITNNASVKTCSRNETAGSIGFKSANNSTSKEYVSSEASLASRSYGLSYINKNKTIPQVSLKDMIKWLESQGKVEGKDFEVDSSCTMGNTVLTLKNQQGKKELIVHYDMGNHSTWSCYEVNEYQNGVLNKITGRDSHGDIIFQTQSYNKDDIKVKYLDENITSSITPKEYEQYLKEKNIKYDISYNGEEDNNRSVSIDIFDDNNNLKDNVWFYYGKNKFDETYHFVSKSNYNEDGKEYRRICYNKDNVEVVSYINYLGE